MTRKRLGSRLKLNRMPDSQPNIARCRVNRCADSRLMAYYLDESIDAAAIDTLCAEST